MSDIIKLVPDDKTGDDLLDACKNQYDEVLIIGINNSENTLSVVSNMDCEQAQHYWISRAARLILDD